MNWKKAWKVTKIVAEVGYTVIGVIGILWLLGSSGGGGRSFGNGGSGSVWTVGSGQTKKPGSWSSGRHK